MMIHRQSDVDCESAAASFIYPCGRMRALLTQEHRRWCAQKMGCMYERAPAQCVPVQTAGIYKGSWGSQFVGDNTVEIGLTSQQAV